MEGDHHADQGLTPDLTAHPERSFVEAGLNSAWLAGANEDVPQGSAGGDVGSRLRPIALRRRAGDLPPVVGNHGRMGHSAGPVRGPQGEVIVLAAVELRPETTEFEEQ